MPTTPRLFVLNAPDIAGDAAGMTFTILAADLTTVLVAPTGSGITAQAAGYTAAVAYDAAWPAHGLIRWSHAGAEVAAEAFDVPADSGGSGYFAVQAATTTAVTLDAADPSRLDDHAGERLTVVAGPGLPRSSVILSSNQSTGTQSVAAMAQAMTADTLYQILPAETTTGLKLAADGLDAVTIEDGVNLRQAIAVIGAACAGVIAGAGTSEITIKGLESSTIRVTATTDSSGNRTVVVLNVPD